ncbi:MAG: multidrug DMT transporter permease [Stygiobacter sp. RIFOXYC12_FULL_38_8]|nr:MAG: multidrug DMT transporter permease [Stygiobacter sp. GWC2_38_9]OGU85068.1 MAG: multidrug DMT transporter permease [Stygiobacter sp. RIFOXYA12_FULL_38_9]OGV07906.1 MAG: multidrug DMT transporter permease [Stygiobacter sp. RIFOXYB2_FULL_37_11]OGV12950.1 MAG: multidrug DMT transporter permease [Stygiobacter sp. RIFOXYC2_FULL_38_25]OGV17677.1 MAG: multidrug DMT transporter permease [Stygiobacter sp. RIFOXYA2_FULL_38_8]OGV27145.1 MAG: multidrug DMT transporter permease [Stygiobacter sp. RIF
MTNSWKPLFAVLVWGLSFIATKRALIEIKPEAIVFIRQLLGISFLLFVALRQKQSFQINLRDHRWVFLLALVACFHLWIQITGLQWTSASNTGWIIGITPVFMTILALIFFKEKISKQQLVGIIISFAGLILLVSKGDLSSIDIINNKGDVLIISSSLTWAVYSMASKKATLNYSPVMTTLYLFIIVAILISPFAINKENIAAVVSLSLGGWSAILFLGILCSGVAYVLWAQALTEMSASRVGAFLYIEPFVTFFGSWILLGEQITFLMLVSGLIIIGGVVLVNRK